jgi:hypothetical protein
MEADVPSDNGHALGRLVGFGLRPLTPTGPLPLLGSERLTQQGRSIASRRFYWKIIRGDMPCNERESF